MKRERHVHRRRHAGEQRAHVGLGLGHAGPEESLEDRVRVRADLAVAHDRERPEELDSIADLLVNFHQGFHSAFNRPAQRFYSEVLLKGLVSDAERKCLEPLALRYTDGSTSAVRNLQRFITESPWDEKHVASIYRERLAGHLAPEVEDEGVITLDPSEFPKKGKESVGVARQYCGTLGKVENCQSGVFAGYTTPKGYGLIDCQLFLPEIWFSEEYEERRQACGIPEHISFQTKPEIALALLTAIRAETARGVDFFRSAVIDAVGRHRGAYAVESIAGVASLEGPLQDDAVLALGRIGGARAKAGLAAVAKAPPDLARTIRAAQCLAGDACDATLNALVESATAANAPASMVRAAVGGLQAIVGLAAAGRLETERELQRVLAGSRPEDIEAAAAGVAGLEARRERCAQPLGLLDRGGAPLVGRGHRPRGVKVTSGRIISSIEMPPCCNEPRYWRSNSWKRVG